MNDNFTRHKGRLIKVDGVTWKWKMGRQSVVAYSEFGRRKCAYASDIKGVTPDIFERGQYKKTSDGMITPSEIAKWLSNKS